MWRRRCATAVLLLALCAHAEEARVSVAEAVAGANSKEVPEGGEPDFSRGAAQWWDRVADVEGSAKVRAGKDSERFMKYLARMDESVDTDAVREKMLKYLDRMDRVENIQDAHENGSSTSTERWRPITLDWTEAQEDKAESERERMMRYLERMERNMWLEVNGTREGRVKDFFRMDEADPKQHLFNDTMAHKGKLETVARVNEEGEQKEDSDSVIQRLVDSHDNEYILSKPHEGLSQMELKEDLELITDLVQLIVAAAIGGLLLGLVHMPVILGYLLAGSVAGPGGLRLIDELVQVETLAHFGVVFLLFVLGIEFSAAKVKAVKAVAVGGGTLIIAGSMLAGMGVAVLLSAPLTQGFFVGAFCSMSSTAVVVKCLMDYRSQHTVHGQVMLGVLILQDCALGLILAIIPNLTLNQTHTTAMLVSKVVRELAMLLLFCAAAYALSSTLVPLFLRLLAHLTRESDELFLLGVVAICLSVALLADMLGLSLEVGAFVAGLMLSGPEYSERTLRQVEPVRNIFAALFLASVGMLMHPAFLWHHLDVLLASLLLLFFGKAVLVATVVRLFGYAPNVALTVGVALAQIGEFSFVLLARAKSLGLVPRTLYLLLLGTTALSLCFAPLAFHWVIRYVPPASGAGLSKPTTPDATGAHLTHAGSFVSDTAHLTAVQLRQRRDGELLPLHRRESLLVEPGDQDAGKMH